MPKKLIDPFNLAPLPKSLSSYVDDAPALTASFSNAEEVSGVSPLLNMWDVETHIFKEDALAEFGFFERLFRTSAKAKMAGVVQEAKRYRLEKIDKAPTVEVGVAVRLYVACRDLKVEATLSVPNLAAAAQLGAAETRVGIYVVGYTGYLGDIVPSPADLDVENFGHYMTAFADIQKRVFSAENERHLSPVLLTYEDDKGSEG